MTDIIDNIRKDREAGTPGDWTATIDETVKVRDNSGQTLCMMFWLTRKGRRNGNEGNANARRIARVPTLEAIVLAAAELADKFDLLMKDLTHSGGYVYEDDFKDDVIALAAFRKALEADHG